MGLYDFTFYDLIDRNAGCFGDQLAWFEADTGKSITFIEVKEMIDRLAFGLQTIGIKKGDRIGILGKNCLEYFLLYSAAAALGAILLPVNWRLSAEEIKYNLNDCAPEVLFLDTEFQDLVKGLKSDLFSVKSYYMFKDQNDIFLGFNDLMNKTGQFEAEDVSQSDGFVIIHTAAVGGRPRGALLSHGNLLCAGLHLNYCFHLTEKDVHLNFLPLFHVGGLFMVISSFIAGVLNVNMSKFDAEKAVELIETKKVTLFFDFSPILASILEQQEKSGQDINSLRAVMGLDTPETIEKYQHITGGTFYTIYGQTETSGLATMGRYNDQPGSAGKMAPLGKIRLIDDYDHPVPNGEVGEITMGTTVGKCPGGRLETNNDTG